jgi:hypothetical protein
MRTTLTLDDDVAVLLAEVQKQRQASLKEVVNMALRTGLVAMTKPRQPRERVHTKTFSTGKCALPNLDCIGDVLAFTEGEDYK